MLCRELSLVKHGEGWGIAIPLVCRAWNCDYCAPRRRRQLIDLAVAGCPNRLITITVNPQVGVSPADRAARLARAWRIVVARAKRQLKLPKIDYLAVFEATKRGEPHLHILARCGFIPQRWLSAQLGQVLRSPVVDIRKVKNGRQAAAYVSKYIGKAPHRFATCKRYWHTRDWCHKNTDKEAGWRVERTGRMEVLRLWLKERRDVTQQTRLALQCNVVENVDEISYGTPPLRAPPLRYRPYTAAAAAAGRALLGGDHSGPTPDPLRL